MQHNEKGDWQIKKVGNLSTLIEQFVAAKRAKQAAENKPIMERLNKALQATSERLTITKDPNDEKHTAILTATIMAKNTSDVAIKRMYYDVMVFNNKDKQIYSYPEHYQGYIAPGQAVELTTKKTLNEMLPDDKALMNFDVANEKIKIQVTYIAFDNGNVLSPKDYVE